MTGKTNLAASVAARLLNRARQTGDDYQTLLTSYCLERFLYRLAVSDRRERFVLKGAMLLRLWSDRPYRATLDLDLLRRGDGAFDTIREDLRAIVATPTPVDAVEFDGARIRIEAIRAEDEYAGTRATLPAHCGKARLMLQIDMGHGDAVWPAPQTCTYPTLLDFPAPELLAYPREAVVAEKLEAMVVLGDRNSRIKDFFDLHHLASRFEFDRATLADPDAKYSNRRRAAIRGGAGRDRRAPCLPADRSESPSASGASAERPGDRRAARRYRQDGRQGDRLAPSRGRHYGILNRPRRAWRRLACSNSRWMSSRSVRPRRVQVVMSRGLLVVSKPLGSEIPIRLLSR